MFKRVLNMQNIKSGKGDERAEAWTIVYLELYMKLSFPNFSEIEANRPASRPVHD